MKSSRLHRLLLWCAATDRTFDVRTLDGVSMLVGKCLHCGRAQCIDLHGRPLSHATLEHIVPRSHGGKDEVANLAVACRRCNESKGSRKDCLPSNDATVAEYFAALLDKRQARMREPLPGLVLPPWPDSVSEPKK